MSDAVVIGGGAAGAVAAITAARRGISVTLIERNDRIGRKLRITGKGRCNVTNACSAREALENVTAGAKFLQSSFYAFPPERVMEFFEGIGVPLKTERAGRVFPQSDDANDVANALAREIRRAGVILKTGRAGAIEVSDGSVTGVRAGGELIPCRAAIVCTGGASYPLTGSSGDGYDLARACGHTVIQPSPSLVPLEAYDSCCAAMTGLSLRNIRLDVTDGGKKPIFSDFGEMLFTHFGISGPLVLSASAHMREFGKKRYAARIDLKPALTSDELDKRILRDFAQIPNRDFRNALDKLLPRLMIPVIIERSGIAPGEKVNSVTRAEREKLVGLLKSFEIQISGARPIAEAIITSGGVNTGELVPATLESKLVKNLHFAGEVINADAYTGGFNLQIAWATGYAAGRHALEE
ncbi:MAG: NAD(P)/FAD-dependent oxidoreductase [Oscillospiraceae bacterium]|jgi:predicted Rossmann fold flavoprotein|nr:NAD(P)/FAD-dependent oxidoreductase [Oscillospiraceae bacterium]